MRLLPKSEADGVRDRAEEQNIRRRQEIAATVIEETKKFNLFMEEIKGKRDAMLSDLASFMEDCSKQKNELGNEVAALEARKKSELKPLNDNWVEIVKESQKLDAQKESQEETEKLNREWQSENVARAMVLSDRQMSIDEKFEAVLNREEALKRAEEMNAITTRELSEKWSAFNSFLEAESSKVEESRKEVINLMADVDKQREWLEGEKRAISDERKHLESQQVTLRLAFDEARTKGIL